MDDEVVAAALRRLVERLAQETERAGVADAGGLRKLSEPLHQVSPALDDAERGGAATLDSVVEHAAAGSDPVGRARPTPRIFVTTADAHAYGSSVWRDTVDGLEQEQRFLLTDYTAGESTWINDMLRMRYPLPPSLQQQVRDLDAILARQPTHEWVRVHKTIQAGRLFPDTDIAAVRPGDRGRFDDFVSTSLHPDGTLDLQRLEHRNVEVTLDVPPGIPAIYVGDVSATLGEYELLLGRNLDFEVSDIQRVGRRWAVAATVTGIAT
ncbi:ADP-ribosyltransferase [Nocardia stercoris]|uniref:ADP ribosyltransferase domain-containing protein n=1 Tax=Nocardia stercoris TaxID=2483361 RepID=A0A3M2KZX3_9NOCA|nr:ADP-ribosyltransferase [Nocardia stercoris]RMI29813.1 hypothetical protein EBN03_23700 [Nocardia stercoris]